MERYLKTYDEFSSINEATNTLKLTIPKNVLEIHKAFKKANRKLYIVGGAVRDAILGKKPKDFDLATDAEPDEVLAIAKKNGFHTTEVGKAFGVVIVDGEEIATFRKDIGKGRRPDAVDYTDIYGDVKRRDLTMNALFYDIDRKEIVDLVGGIKDLENRHIRTVGKAELRFEEDALRKLRALRFAARINGKIEKSTMSALRKNPSLDGVSGERIRDEFIKSLTSAQSQRSYLKMAKSLKMLDQILPGLAFKNDYLDNPNYKLVIAYLLRTNDSETVYRKLKTLKYPDKEAYDISFLIKLYNFDRGDVYKLKKIHKNSSLIDREIIEWGKVLKQDLKKFVKFKLSVTGNDVMKLGLKGKGIGDKIEQMEIDNYINESLGTHDIKRFRDLYERMPKSLQKRVMDLSKIPQHPTHHPEGNVLKHTILVVNRAIESGDIDLALAALFHDIGKDETLDFHPKTGLPTAYGHEKVSASLAKKHKKWIEEMGGNAANVFYIIKNHMRLKFLDDMRPKKQNKLKSFRAFGKLSKFGKYDRGGY